MVGVSRRRVSGGPASLREDHRGRVPFAFLGAILLLTSTLYAATVAPPAVTEPVTAETVDDAQIAARMALGTAIRRAGRQAAADPVLERADSPPGSLLAEDRPFRSALRLRIALAARQTLRAAHSTSGSVGANVSLPPIESREDARAAMDNVTLTQKNGDDYRVRISGLRVSVTRHGRPLDRFTYNTSLTMPIPALALHDRTQRFESRLHASVLDPGFTQDLTTRLFAITWTRGYAQYGGAPISNVLGNRHVEVMANDALLAQQAAVFGAASQDGRRLTRRAATDVALRDGLRGAEAGVQSALTSSRDGGGSKPGRGEQGGSVSMPSAFDAEQTYRVDHTADETFLGFVEGEDASSLESVVDRVYQADVRARGHDRYLGTERFHSGSKPANGSFFWRETDTDRWLDGGDWTTHRHGSTLRTYEGKVVVERTTTRWWSTNRSLGTVRDTHRRSYRVTIDVECRYRPPGIAPDRPADTCPFGRVARDRLSEDSVAAVGATGSGLERLAVGIVSGDGGTWWRRVDIEPPEQARQEAYDATAALRQSVRATEVTMEPRSVASSATPANALADSLVADRRSLVDAPSRYGSAVDRAESAARAAYLETLVSRLRGRTPVMHRVQQTLSETLRSHAIPQSPPERDTARLSGIASEIDADPAYLSVADRGEGPAMDARNVNLFSVPYGDAADTIEAEVDLDSTATVSLRTAARTLQVLESRPGSSPAEQELEAAVSDAVEGASRDFETVLAPTIGRGDARQAVTAAYDRWDSPTDRALAITDGKMASAIADSARSDTNDRRLDELAVRLRVTATEIQAESTIHVDEAVVAEARQEATGSGSAGLKDALKSTGTDAAGEAWERATDSKPASLPAGLPLLPVPGYWYATANAWTVSVRGSYDRFTVRARNASPGRTRNGTIEYVREAGPVRLDVDGDGAEETIGRNRPVAFEADTGVVVVVPPGGTGVGDVDGNADERSPGWGR